MQTQHPLPQNDKAQPLISFIITYYNEPIDMLKKCIDSILMLTLNREEREIIVIDDGSDVSPLNLLTDVADQMIYIRQPNQGLSQARNTGIAMANGQYLQFVDADDSLVSRNYDKCLDFIRFKDADIVLFDFATKEVSSAQLANNEVFSGTEYMHNNNLRASACGYIQEESIGKLAFHKGYSTRRRRIYTAAYYSCRQGLQHQSASILLPKTHGIDNTQKG